MPTTADFFIDAASRADADSLAAVAALTFPLACPDTLSRESIAAFTEENLSPSAFAALVSSPGTIVILARELAAPGGVAPVEGSADERGRAPYTATGDPLGYVVGIPGRGSDPEAGTLVEAENPLYVSKFYAAPRAHGSGLAAALMERTVADARAAGHDSLWLGTNADNARAQRFYEKSGFRPRGNRDFLVGGQWCRDVVLERPL